jgi:hypothetical protein
MSYIANGTHKYGATSYGSVLGNTQNITELLSEFNVKKIAGKNEGFAYSLEKRLYVQSC